MSGKGIKLLLFKEVSEGDLRKFAADAADADTGRGARDLRFPHEPFDPIFARLLPRIERKPAGRKKTQLVDVRCGAIRWHEGGVERSAEIEYWPPNSARPSEGRWAKVNTLSVFATAPPDNEGRAFVLLVQDDGNVVWLFVVTEAQLRQEEWDQNVASKILDCGEPGKRFAQGFLDFEKRDEYCHGR